MINLQANIYSVTLGSSAWKDTVQRAVLHKRCVCCDDYLHLSDDEILTDFELLHPLVAEVDAWLLEQIESFASLFTHAQRVALIRWKDDTESLVVFPTAEGTPSPKLLTAAYWNGFSTQHISTGLDALRVAP